MVRNSTSIYLFIALSLFAQANNGILLAKISPADQNKVKTLQGLGDSSAVQFVHEKIKQGKDLNEWNETLAVIGISNGHLKAGDIYFEAARNFARAEPENPRALATFALALALIGKADASLKLSKRALQLDPKNARALVAQAHILSNQGSEFELVKEIIGKAVKLAPKDREVNFIAYRLYQKLLEDDAAEKALDRIIEANPKDASAYVQRAWYFKDIRDFKRAADDCQKAVNINPKYEGALYLQGRMLHHLERWQDAIAAYNKIIQIKKSNEESYIGSPSETRLAECYAALGQNQKAIERYSIAIKHMSPEKTDAVFSKASIHMNKKSKEDYIKSWSSRAQLYAKSGQMDRAIKDSTGLLAVFPKNPTGLHERANEYQKAGKYELALKDVETLISIDPDVAVWYRTKVDLLKKMGRKDEAQRFEKQSNSLEKFGIK
ncbi:MAG: tetratricopeptide repeat protein [Cyanobacteria bacterium TGS_CYA1]|nr:tetratricopeptide repeat protein [Cyanobacteria bacterium TGS_CYA1]